MSSSSLRAERIPPGNSVVTDASARIQLDHAGDRVLVAEDNPVNRLIAEELMRSAGLVETAPSTACRP